ncbi:hypothetical protein Peur_016386 [Populus x canadensis]
MGRVFAVGLEAEGNGSHRCRFCDTPLALGDHLLSRDFLGQDACFYKFWGASLLPVVI